jgi:hypothetical protein
MDSVLNDLVSWKKSRKNNLSQSEPTEDYENSNTKALEDSMARENELLNYINRIES